MVEEVDVLFVNATYGADYCPPLSLGYLMAVLEKPGVGLTTEMIDAGGVHLKKSESDLLVRAVSRFSPRIVGISSMDTELDAAIQFSQDLKDQGYMVFMGGYGPTFQPERCLEEGNCDAVIRGEAERTVEDIFPKVLAGKYDAIHKSRGVSYVNNHGKIISNPDQEIIYDLDSLPFPLRKFDPEDYVLPKVLVKGSDESPVYSLPFMSSRGCHWHQCVFCNGAEFPGQKIYRVRSNENILKELKETESTYGPCVVHDYSACFLGGRPKQMENFLDQFSKTFEDAYLDFMIRPDSLLNSRSAIERNINSLYGISVGIENMSDDFLARNRKGVTSEVNREAIRFMKDLKAKRGPEGICYPPLCTMFTLDCDLETTRKELAEHYGWLKKLKVIESWEPNSRTFFPYISSEQQEKIWMDDAVSRKNFEAYLIRNVILYIDSSSELNLASTKFQEDKLQERAERLQEIFDPLVEFA